ncbi:MAG: tetratricopeptide repeat protein [Chitinispirillaceae bacterium]|nr:tetratricopeptide repeat protein [Chitinispirillaceae bacterium]
MKQRATIIIVLPLLMICSKNATDEGVVRIGKTTVTKSSFDAFEKIVRMYPTEAGAYFPAFRPTISHLVETEVIFRQKGVRAIKDSLKNTANWQWKKRYFPAQIFYQDYILENLGVPDETIASYYEAHKDSFKVTVKGDSTKKDSTYFRPLTDVKRTVVDSLFLRMNKPDSAFLARYDSLPEKGELHIQWLQYVRQNASSIFMKRLYKETTGTPYPDSLSDIFGEGKYITQADMDVIISWIPETRRHFYETPEQKRGLVEWLVKWKLFSDYAEKLGRNKLPPVRQAMDWAWKLNVVYCYVTTVMEPALKSTITIDTAMMLYSLYDENGYHKNTDLLNNKMRVKNEEIMKMKVDSAIVAFRQKYTVTFLQNDWKDSKNEQPSVVLSTADALRDSGKTTEARDAYETLTKNFVFFPEGQTALVELAKLQTEQQMYTQAIENYRKFLLLNPDQSKRCNTFFMIGFIYDEYLDKPLHAEENYKWVLKNTPECELADDAEFMMLHLNEPMSSVEELRGEAQRQGRKIDFSDEEVITEDTVQTSMAGGARQ